MFASEVLTVGPVITLDFLTWGLVSEKFKSYFLNAGPTLLHQSLSTFLPVRWSLIATGCTGMVVLEGEDEECLQAGSAARAEIGNNRRI